MTKMCWWRKDLSTQKCLTPVLSVPSQYFLYISVPQILWVPLNFSFKPLLVIMASHNINSFPTLTSLMSALFFFRIWLTCFGKEWALWIQSECVIWETDHVLPTPSQWAHCPSSKLELLCTVSDCAWLTSTHDSWGITAQNGDWK